MPTQQNIKRKVCIFHNTTHVINIWCNGSFKCWKKGFKNMLFKSWSSTCFDNV